MIHPEDQARIDEAKAAMEIATGPDQVAAVKRFRITEDKAIRRALTDLDELLSKSPVKSANRMLAYRHIEDASMRLGKDLQECSEPNPYPNSKDTSNTKVDPTAPEVTKVLRPCDFGDTVADLERWRSFVFWDGVADTHEAFREWKKTGVLPSGFILRP